MGAGGSTIALTWHLMQKARGADRPSRIVVSNRSPARLEEIRRIHAELHSGVPTEYVLAPQASDNDAVLATLRPGSLVINATGLGKDAPGSPLTNGARFPERSIVWDLNYRGDLVFLDQARAQETSRSLQIEDGWTYFLHGWTQVIAEVFHIRIPAHGPEFETLSETQQRRRRFDPLAFTIDSGAPAMIVHHHGPFAFNTLPLEIIDRKAREPGLPVQLIPAREGLEVGMG